jgi:hypothetical protein
VDSATAALLPKSPARIVDQHVAHDLRSDCVEMGPVVPSRAAFRHQAHECLLHERRRLNCMVLALAIEVAPGQSKEVHPDQRPQFIERGSIALTPGSQQSRDFAGLTFHTPPTRRSKRYTTCCQKPVVARAG